MIGISAFGLNKGDGIIKIEMHFPDGRDFVVPPQQAGDGIIKIEMHFLPDVYVPCEVCKGRRYNRETLEVRYKGRNIAEVLQMTVEEGEEFFSAIPKIHRPDKPGFGNKLATLLDVGLGYIPDSRGLHCVPTSSASRRRRSRGERRKG